MWMLTQMVNNFLQVVEGHDQFYCYVRFQLNWKPILGQCNKIPYKYRMMYIDITSKCEL